MQDNNNMKIKELVKKTAQICAQKYNYLYFDLFQSIFKDFNIYFLF